MKLRIIISRRNLGDKKTRDILEKHKERIIKKAPNLFGWLEIIPPKEVLLDAYDYANSSGRLMWHPKRGFAITINTDYCRTLSDKGIWVADHELAHIGAILKYNEWTHRQRFKTICKFVRGKNCRKCKYCQ